MTWEFDLFFFYRRLLMAISGIYALVMVVDRMTSFWRGLRGSRHLEMARKYVVVQLLRLRVRALWPDLLHLGIWCAVLSGLITLHRYVNEAATWLQRLTT